MKHTRKKALAVLSAILLLLSGTVQSVLAEEAAVPPSAEKADATATEKVLSDLGVEEGSLELPCKSAILMEATTGAVLYTQNAEESMPPASVTKVMTLLLLMEAIDSGVIHLDDKVTVSANAASMGGSQVYLKEG